MKIELSKHDILESDNVNIGDIPLAYVDTVSTAVSSSIVLKSDFAADEKNNIEAYKEFSDKDVLLFDTDNVPIKDRLKRIGNTYYYIPQNIKEFTPSKFTCSVLIKKNMSFSDDKNYNLRVGCIENSSSLTLSSKLITIFGNAYKQGLCPSNIKVNSGATSPQSLIGAANNNADFIFASSTDGTIANTDIDALLSKYVNIWISTTAFGDMLQDTGTRLTTIQEGILCNFYNNVDRATLSSKIFNKTLRISTYPQESCTYTFPYEDVLIIEQKNKGFLIVTPDNFMENIASNVKVVYDVMMYIFLNSYYSASSSSLWITDEPVNYMSYIKSAINLYHKNVNINDLLLNDYYEIGDDYNLTDVTTNNSNVKFISMSENGDLMFRKISATDPVKDTGESSYLSTNSTVYIYSQEEIYLLKTKVNIEKTIDEDNNTLTLTISPIFDSYNKIYSPETIELEISDFTCKYYICASISVECSTSIISLVNVNEYDLSTCGAIIAEISFNTAKDISAIDIRISGGGLPIEEDNNYNLIDIGNIYGRPYRLGSTIIIKLPKKLEDYNDRILEAINLHIAAGDYPIILYK